MFAVIRRYNLHERPSDQIDQRVREGFVPLIARLPGFVSYNLVRSTDGTMVSISVFETREAAEQSTRLASDWAHDHVPSLVRNAPVILSGEVIVSQAGAPSRIRTTAAEPPTEHRAPPS